MTKSKAPINFLDPAKLRIVDEPYKDGRATPVSKYEAISGPHRAVSEPQQFPPLESVTRPTVDTAAAAYYLNRKPQTMRTWACMENGPLRPIRISGRLAWPVSELRRVLGVAA